jgi:hypothetical protein
MKYAVEIGSGTMIYISSFVKIGSEIQMLMKRGYTDTQTAWRSHKPVLFIKIRKLGSIIILSDFRQCTL